MQANSYAFSSDSNAIAIARRRYHLQQTARRLPLDAAPASTPDRLRNRLIEPPRSDWRAVTALVAGAIAIHFVILYVVRQRDAPPVPVVQKTAPIVIEMTRPPPPPPPVAQPPKPLPQITRPQPAPIHHAAPPPRPATAPAPAPAAQPALSPAPSPATAAPVVADAAPTAPVPPPVPVERVTEAHGSAGYRHNPPPVYPDAAQEHNWQGRVLLRVHVLTDGHADDVKVAQSSGYQVLDDAAVRTVTHWLFAPATRGDAPVDGWANVPINFKLGN
jgi:periplasmic protein TonB